jgi:hypothetical protein
MKTIKEYSPYIVEAWAVWEVMRKLGFKADDIYWIFGNTLNANPAPGMALNIVLRTQGKELSVTCSMRLTDDEAKKLEEDSREFQETLNAGKFDEADLTEHLHKSYVWTNKERFLLVLKAKGFEYPFKLN